MKAFGRALLALAVVFALMLGGGTPVAKGEEDDADAPAEPSDSYGGTTDDGVADGAADYSVSAVHDSGAVRGPGVVNGFVSGVSADTSGRIPPEASAPCLGWRIVMKKSAIFTAGGTLVPVLLPVLECKAFLTCGTERVDDYRTGRFSGGGSGRMRQYIKSAFAPVGLTPPAPGAGGVTLPTDIGGIATAAAPPVQPDDEAMLVMRWCVRDDTDALVMPWESGRFGVSFGWETTVDAEYPVDAIGFRLVEEVRARIQTYEPVLETVPPLAQQRTFVRWPTWMWVEDPLDEVHRYAVNDLETVRVEVRATLRDLVFTVGDGTSVTCLPAEMVAYRPGVHDPLDPPGCHYVFEELASVGFAVTMSYDVEVRVTYSPTGPPFADSVWITHPTVSTIPQSSEPVDLAVRELRSVNVRDEITVDLTSTTGD